MGSRQKPGAFFSISRFKIDLHNGESWYFRWCNYSPFI